LTFFGVEIFINLEDILTIMIFDKSLEETLDSHERFKMIGDNPLGVSKRNILDLFYAEKPLYGRIARGEEDAFELVRMYDEKYPTFWSRVFRPKIDLEFDQRYDEISQQLEGVLKEGLCVQRDMFQTRPRTIRANLFDGLLGTVLFCLSGMFLTLNNSESIPLYEKLSPLLVSLPLYYASSKFLFIYSLNSRRSLVSSLQKVQDYLRLQEQKALSSE
jgi:hypothetical protein